MHKIIDGKWIEGNIENLESGEIFVYGSNLAGRHGRGAAKKAMEFGAVYGQGIGLVGRTYGIPTKNPSIVTMPLDYIEYFIKYFIEDSKSCMGILTFLVTQIGCGLAGYKGHHIAPFFKDTIKRPDIMLPIEWREYLECDI